MPHYTCVVFKTSRRHWIEVKQELKARTVMRWAGLSPKLMLTLLTSSSLDKQGNLSRFLGTFRSHGEMHSQSSSVFHSLNVTLRSSRLNFSFLDLPKVVVKCGCNPGYWMILCLLARVTSVFLLLWHVMCLKSIHGSLLCFKLTSSRERA